jgi:hypothetical protein
VGVDTILASIYASLNVVDRGGRVLARWATENWGSREESREARLDHASRDVAFSTSQKEEDCFYGFDFARSSGNKSEYMSVALAPCLKQHNPLT